MHDHRLQATDAPPAKWGMPLGTETTNVKRGRPMHLSSLGPISGGAMSIDTPDTVIIAGWYPDPTDESLARWWDGSEWSQTTRPRKPAGPAREELEQQEPQQYQPQEQQQRYFSPVPIRTDATLPPIDPYRPMNRRHDSQGFVSMGVKPTMKFTPTRAYTGSVWAIATMPVWTTLLVLGLVIGLGDLYTTFLIAATGVIVFAVVLGFAIHDRKVLLNSLHPTAASPGWMVLTPLVYLISRGVHVSRAVGHGWAPLIVLLICSFMPAAVVLAFDSIYGVIMSFIGGF